MSLIKAINMVKNFFTLVLSLFLCWMGINYYLYHITAVDGRTRVLAHQEEWNITPDIVHNIAPQSYARNVVHPSFIDALPPSIAFPLGGVPNVRVIYCEEDEGWHIEKNDRYGFFNPDMAWEQPIDVALLGDSFAQGACTNHHIRYWYDKLSGENIVSMGMGGNGTLIEYAGFRELLQSNKTPNKIFWLIVANDITDLSAELRTPILHRYLTDDSFTQNYFELDFSEYTKNALALVPKYLKSNSGNIQFSRDKIKPEFPKILNGFYLRLRIEKFKKLLAWKKSLSEKKDDLVGDALERARVLAIQEKNNLETMKNIFKRSKDEADLASVELEFVFIPSASHCYTNTFPNHFLELEKFFDKEKISYFRGHEILEESFCASLFATKRGGI
mgnify:CR=1 FL=1|tara:strand:+ start:1257 stop:2420 length:1164 start_codon:yes stop_codon:yes gene_type:complete